jgi:phenylpyruvate tautomerase PptA (4-oxalocrotonate tautomerase family)
MVVRMLFHFNYVVTVYPTATITSSGAATICNNTAQNYLITSPVAGTTYSWDRAAVAGISNAAVTGQTANPITETLVNTTNAPVNVTYVITPSANGCANPVPFNYVVTVYPTATITSTDSATICNNTAQNYLITSPVAGTTYSWTRNAVAGISNTGVAGQTANPITETLVNTTSAPIDVTYVIIPSANGCANPVPFTYVITVYPTATISSAATDDICDSTAQNYLITSPVAGTTYTWTRNAVSGISNAGVAGQTGNPITEVLDNTTNAPINVTYVITPSANGLCESCSFCLHHYS